MSQDPENDRVELPGNDDESLREYGRQLALDSLLEMALANRASGTNTALPSPQARLPAPRRRRIGAIVAASLTIAAAVSLIFWRADRGRVPKLPDVDIVQAPAPVEPVITPVANWRIEANGPGAFDVIAPRRIRLNRGELHISPAAGDDDEPLLIETPAGTVTADKSSCFVGSHEISSSNLEGPPMLNHLTRVLVFAGLATLANEHGLSTGGAGHLLAAERDKPPVDQTIQANSEFALDLYGRMARDNPDRNLFFSPYSMSTALAMAAEGARSETAE